MITFDNAGKRFGNLDAVKDFSITMKDGEILGLLGPNGARKTTLMLMMGTVYRPTSGTITVNGFDVVKQPNEVRRLIGIAFQDPGRRNPERVRRVELAPQDDHDL